MAKRKPRSGWTLPDELKLLEKWEERAYDLRNTKRNAHIYQDISNEMGKRFTAEEVHCKVKNLTKKYREERRRIATFDGSSSEWKHYHAIHRIIGSTDVDSPTVPSPTMSPIKRKRSYKGEVIKLFKQHTDILKTTAEESKRVSEEVVEAIREHNRLTEKLINLVEILTEKL